MYKIVSNDGSDLQHPGYVTEEFMRTLPVRTKEGKTPGYVSVDFVLQLGTGTKRPSTPSPSPPLIRIHSMDELIEGKANDWRYDILDGLCGNDSFAAVFLGEVYNSRNVGSITKPSISLSSTSGSKVLTTGTLSSLKNASVGKGQHGEVRKCRVYLNEVVCEVVYKTTNIDKMNAPRWFLAREILIQDMASRHGVGPKVLGFCREQTQGPEEETVKFYMEFAGGISLAALLKENNKELLDNRKDILTSIAIQLKVLHEELGLLHNDLRAENIQVEGKTATLLDFGRSVFMSKYKDPLRDHLSGYVYLMSPNQAKNIDKDMNDKLKIGVSDELYSFGLLVVSLYAGQLPETLFKSINKDGLTEDEITKYLKQIPQKLQPILREYLSMNGKSIQSF